MTAELSRRIAWTVALVATLTMTVSYIDRATLGVLAPTVTKELGISEVEYGWLTSAFSIAYLLATPLAGWWIDRIGARRGLVGSVAVWSVVAALHALAPGLGVLFALRIALGMAEGPSFPGAAQTVQRVLPASDRARGFGVLFTGSSVGSMVVPPIASALYGMWGWQAAFLGTAVIGLAWVPLWIGLSNRVDVRERLDAVPAVVASDPRTSFRTLIRDPLMIRGLLAILAVAPVVGFSGAWGAKYLMRTFHLAQQDVGAFLWFPPLMLDLGAIGFGDLASRLRRAQGAPPLLLHGIAAALCASFALLPLADSPVLGMAIIGAGMLGGGAVYTLVTADLLSRMPASAVSFAGGTLAGAQSLALIIASPLIGRLVSSSGDYDVAAIVLGAWVLPGSIAWQLLPVSRGARA